MPCLGSLVVRLSSISSINDTFADQFDGFTGTDRIHIGDMGASYFDNISADGNCFS